jgi:hypothetical protein
MTAPRISSLQRAAPWAATSGDAADSAAADQRLAGIGHISVRRRFVI